MNHTVKITGLAHSKLRNAIGLVGIEADPIKQEIQVKMAKHWDRKQINNIASDVANMWYKVQWENTIVDLLVGEHVIQGLRRASQVPLRIVYIKKKVLDPGDIRRVKVMDLVEMTQFMLQLKLATKLKFPKHPTASMTELELQVALYSEHATEQGAINYYAPGDELDNLTKGLLLACFAARPFLQESMEVAGGSIGKGRLRDTMQDAGTIISQLSGDVTNKGFKRRF